MLPVFYFRRMAHEFDMSGMSQMRIKYKMEDDRLI
jgi:hypothetical protein